MAGKYYLFSDVDENSNSCFQKNKGADLQSSLLV
jgi:hypothetical protein